MGAPANHSPKQYTMSATSAANLESFSGIVRNGDTAVVYSVGDQFVRTYTFYESAVGTPDGLTILDCPDGSTGRWLLNNDAGCYQMYFLYSGSLSLEASSDPSINPDTVSITHTGTGDYSIVFDVDSVLRPTAAEPSFGSIMATANCDGWGSAAAFWDGAHTVKVKTFGVGFPDAPGKSNMSFTLSISVARF